VARIVDGDVTRGRFVDDAAYGAFLLGALAEEKGDFDGALEQYAAVAEADGDDPEVWTSTARVRCRRDPKDPAADADLARALSIAPGYPPALVARELCDAQRARRSPSPGGDATLEALRLATADAAVAGDGDERRRRLARSLLESGHAAGWEGLAAWGLAHGDPTVAVRGLAGLAHAAPRHRFALGQWALDLAGRGQVTAARTLAAALLDAGGDRSPGDDATPAVAAPLVVRLAIDEAILGHDVAKVYARSARAHVGVELAAGRAWAIGAVALARDLVAPTLRADPSSAQARLVHDGAAGRAGARLLAAAHDHTLLADVGLPFARDVAAGDGPAAARRVVAMCGHELPIAGDALLTPIAVDLAIAGAVDEPALPSDARIELAARRGAPPDAALLDDAALDARHKLLGLALLRPTDPLTRSLADRMSAAAADDRLVAVAVVKIARAAKGPIPAAARARLESASAADPLAAAELVSLLAEEASPTALLHARKDLAALAKTPAERARSAAE
jgi:hypothetical protein